ncbi:hypothetical protein [Blastococcus sp. SYSU DS0616]
MEYRATTTLVVLPAPGADEAAAYYDTLSRGQVATTFAEILALRADPEAATEGAVEAGVSVEVVPDTSLIQVAVTSEDAAAAETGADAVLGQVEPYFGQLGAPYEVSVVDEADGSAERIGFSPGVLAAVVGAVAVIAGLAAYLAIRSLQNARRRTVPMGSLPPVPATVDGHADGTRSLRTDGPPTETAEPVQADGAGVSEARKMDDPLTAPSVR